MTKVILVETLLKNSRIISIVFLLKISPPRKTCVINLLLFIISYQFQLEKFAVKSRQIFMKKIATIEILSFSVQILNEKCLIALDNRFGKKHV